MSLKPLTIERFSKFGRWAAAFALLFTAGWSGFHAYMIAHWVNRWPASIAALPEKATLATFFVATYWPLFGVFALLSFVSAGYLFRKNDIPALFAMSLACAFILAVVMFNVLVVSTGFELSSLSGN